MSKYKISVVIEANASTHIGEIECDSIEEYNLKAAALWESKDYEHPTTDAYSKFDLSDWDIADIAEEDLKYYMCR